VSDYVIYNSVFVELMTAEGIGPDPEHGDPGYFDLCQRQALTLFESGGMPMRSIVALFAEARRSAARSLERRHADDGAWQRAYEQLWRRYAGS
jgi:hypothetical protein